MKKVAIKLITNVLLSLIVAMTLLAPGFLYNLLYDPNFVWITSKYLGIFFLFGLALVACRSFKVAVVVLAGLALLEVTQFSSLAYFKDYITPYDIGYMVTEFLDVAREATASFSYYYDILFIVVLPYSVCLLILQLSWKHKFSIPYAPLVVTLILLFPALRINLHSDHKDIIKFFPVRTTPTLANTLNSYSIWATRLVPRQLFARETETFLPIRIAPKPFADRTTVVLVMGESFTSNRMSLFGFDRKTTPRLQALASNPDFIYKTGYSAANATRSTLPMFYNVQYNPLNRGLMEKQPANLFRLARQNGFKTIYISAQKANCLNGVKTSFIDTFISYDTNPATFDQFKDEGLLKHLESLDLGERNFIVLHQRNIHAPYAENYSHRPDLALFPTEGLTHEQYMKNSYDNGVLYNDYLLSAIISYFRAKDLGHVYIFMTSDHGEEFGENGQWGHDHLTLGSALVPVLFYGIDADPAFMQRFRNLHMPTHFEVGLLIADRLGYTIDNPNRQDGVYYINGTASFGMSGYMKIYKSNEKNIASTEIFH